MAQIKLEKGKIGKTLKKDGQHLISYLEQSLLHDVTAMKSLADNLQKKGYASPFMLSLFLLFVFTLISYPEQSLLHDVAAMKSLANLQKKGYAFSSMLHFLSLRFYLDFLS